MWLQLNNLFTQNRNLFQMAFQIKNYLWTHAGVHDDWYKLNILEQEYVIRDGVKCEWLEIDKRGNVADILNFCFEAKHEPIFDCSFYRKGRAKIGGPLWADKIEIYNKPLNGYHQIVGHSRTNKIEHYNNYSNKDTSVTFVDCINISYNKYYIIEI